MLGFVVVRSFSFRGNFFCPQFLPLDSCSYLFRVSFLSLANASQIDLCLDIKRSLGGPGACATAHNRFIGLDAEIPKKKLPKILRT